MIRFLIASHGYLANGFKSAIEIIMGKEIADKISTINAFVGDCNNDVKSDLEHFVKNIPSSDKLIVFSDIMHGSVNQFLIPLIEENRVFLITGVNFPLLCELVAKYCYTDDQEINNDELLAIVEMAKKEITLVNHYLKHVVIKDNESDFFENN
ncbi:MAG: hypothetical protein VB009_02485 [Erysipelotrichaceae bacterium]|nr:hypothetical protein [Erysipelotrichaceae bacterium]